MTPIKTAIDAATIPPDITCPWCRAGRDKQTIITSEILQSAPAMAITCLSCGAHGPVADSIEAAQRAWTSRITPPIELAGNLFCVGFGYDKFALTFEQLLTWRATDDLQMSSRVAEKRRLLQDFGLLPPTKLVDEQRSF